MSNEDPTLVDLRDQLVLAHRFLRENGDDVSNRMQKLKKNEHLQAVIDEVKRDHGKMKTLDELFRELGE